MPTRPAVLLVEDDRAVARALRRLLDNWVQIDAAEAAEEAERMALGKEYRAVLTDHDLPGHSGAWLLERLAVARPGTRRVLMSGRDLPELPALQSKGIVHRFLKKPAAQEEILEALLR